MTEVRRLGAAAELTLMADVELVLKDEFEELGMTELAGGSLLKAGRKALTQAGETELLEGRVEGGSVHGSVKQSGVRSAY